MKLKKISVLLVFTLFFEQFSFASSDLKPFTLNEIVDQEKSQGLSWAKTLLQDLPRSVATIEDAWKGPDPEQVVYLIQNAHTNDSAQLNLSKMLDLILGKEAGNKKDGKPFHVFVEAGAGNDSLSFLRQDSTLEHRKEVALKFLKRGLLHGEEYLDLTSDHNFTLWGVEDIDLYLKAVEDYRYAVKERERFLNYLKKIDQTINTLKPVFYNPILLSFEEKQRRFLKDELALTDYFEILTQQATGEGLSLENYPHLRALSGIRKMEKSVDFRLANEEQLKAIASLSKEDQQELTAAGKVTSGKMTAIGHKETEGFYALLEEKLISSQELVVRNSGYPNLFKYFDYLKASQKLDPAAILKEKDLLEEAVLKKLSLNQDEEILLSCQKMLGYLEKLFNLTLTPQEYEDYRRLTAEDNFTIAYLTGFLNRKIMDMNKYHERVSFLEEGHEAMVKNCEAFYELTKKRDSAFIKNMSEKMQRENQKKSVLITGGFHTPSLKALLKQKNVSYISMIPQVTHETNKQRYEEILLNQKIDPGIIVNSLALQSMVETPHVAETRGALMDVAGAISPAHAARAQQALAAKTAARLTEAAPVGAAIEIQDEEPVYMKGARLSAGLTDIPDAPEEALRSLIGRVYLPSLNAGENALANLAVPEFSNVVYSEDIPDPMALREMVYDASGQMRPDLRERFLREDLERIVPFDLMAGAAQRFSVMVGGQAKGSLSLRNIIDMKPALEELQRHHQEMSSWLQSDPEAVSSEDVAKALAWTTETVFVKPDYTGHASSQSYSSKASLVDFGGSDKDDPIARFNRNYSIVEELIKTADEVHNFLIVTGGDEKFEDYSNLSLGSMHIAAYVMRLRTLAAERYELEQAAARQPVDSKEKEQYVNTFIQTSAQAAINVNEDTASLVLEDLKAWGFFGLNPDRVVFVLSPNIPVVVKDPSGSGEYVFMTEEVAGQMKTQQFRHPYGHAFILPLLYFPENAFRYDPVSNAFKPLGKPALSYMVDDLKAWNFIQRNIDDLGGISPDSVLPPGLFLLSDPEFRKAGYQGVAEATINATTQSGGGHILEKRPGVDGPVARVMEDKELKYLEAALAQRYRDKTPAEITEMMKRIKAAGPASYLNRMQFTFDARSLPEADGTAIELMRHLTHAVWTPKKGDFGEYGIFEAFFSTVLTEMLNLALGYDGRKGNVPFNPAVKQPLEMERFGDKGKGFVGRVLKNYDLTGYKDFLFSNRTAVKLPKLKGAVRTRSTGSVALIRPIETLSREQMLGYVDPYTKKLINELTPNQFKLLQHHLSHNATGQKANIPQILPEIGPMDFIQWFESLSPVTSGMMEEDVYRNPIMGLLVLRIGFSKNEHTIRDMVLQVAQSIKQDRQNTSVLALPSSALMAEVLSRVGISNVVGVHKTDAPGQEIGMYLQRFFHAKNPMRSIDEEVSQTPESTTRIVTLPGDIYDLEHTLEHGYKDKAFDAAVIAGFNVSWDYQNNEANRTSQLFKDISDHLPDDGKVYMIQETAKAISAIEDFMQDAVRMPLDLVAQHIPGPAEHDKLFSDIMAELGRLDHPFVDIKISHVVPIRDQQGQIINEVVVIEARKPSIIELGQMRNTRRQRFGARLAQTHASETRLVEGVGEIDPDWQRLNVAAEVVLDLVQSGKKSVAQRDVLPELYDKLKAQGLETNDERMVGLLEKLVDLDLLRKREDNYILKVSPRYLAVKTNNVFYILKDFQKILNGSALTRAQELVQLLKEYDVIVDKWKLYPVESRWPVLRAVSLLSEEEQKKLIKFLSEYQSSMGNIHLVDSILLMFGMIQEEWLNKNVPELKGRNLYYVFAETWLVAGGLGRVGQYHTTSIKKLVGDNANVITIEPYYPYQLNREGLVEPVDYSTLPIPVKNLRRSNYAYSVVVRGEPVSATVYEGENDKGIKVYLIKDDEEKYTRMLYRYGQHGTASWEEFTEFISRASLELIKLLEADRKESKKEEYKPPVIWSNDAQTGLLPFFKRLYDEKPDDQKPVAAQEVTIETIKAMRRETTFHIETAGKGHKQLFEEQGLDAIEAQAQISVRHGILTGVDNRELLLRLRARNPKATLIYTAASSTEALWGAQNGADVIFASGIYFSNDDIRAMKDANPQIVIFDEVDVTQVSNDNLQAKVDELRLNGVHGIILKPYATWENGASRLKALAEKNSDIIFAPAGGVFQNKIGEVLAEDMPSNVIAAIGVKADSPEVLRQQLREYDENLPESVLGQMLKQNLHHLELGNALDSVAVKKNFGGALDFAYGVFYFEGGEKVDWLKWSPTNGMRSPNGAQAVQSRHNADVFTAYPALSTRATEFISIKVNTAISKINDLSKSRQWTDLNIRDLAGQLNVSVGTLEVGRNAYLETINRHEKSAVDLRFEEGRLQIRLKSGARLAEQGLPQDVLEIFREALSSSALRQPDTAQQLQRASLTDEEKKLVTYLVLKNYQFHSGQIKNTEDQLLFSVLFGSSPVTFSEFLRNDDNTLNLTLKNGEIIFSVSLNGIQDELRRIEAEFKSSTSDLNSLTVHGYLTLLKLLSREVENGAVSDSAQTTLHHIDGGYLENLSMDKFQAELISIVNQYRSLKSLKNRGRDRLFISNLRAREGNAIALLTALGISSGDILFRAPNEEDLKQGREAFYKSGTVENRSNAVNLSVDATAERASWIPLFAAGADLVNLASDNGNINLAQLTADNADLRRVFELLQGRYTSLKGINLEVFVIALKDGHSLVIKLPTLGKIAFDVIFAGARFSAKATAAAA